VDSVIHLGSARPPYGIAEITESLEFTKNLVLQSAAYQVPEFIYVSSQAVYGEKDDSNLWKESSLTSPNSPYGMAKLAGEMFVQGLRQFVPQSRTWILRLSRVYGKGCGMRWHEMPHKFVADFWQKKEISIKGGKQRFDFIHIKDVISGICYVLKANNNQNNWMYNLGSGHSVAIRDLADCINNAAEQIGLEKVPIRIVPGKDERKFGMDTTLFCRDFNWCPDVSLGEGIQELVQAAEKGNLFIQN